MHSEAPCSVGDPGDAIMSVSYVLFALSQSPRLPREPKGVCVVFGCVSNVGAPR
jgi:hypothetical protein